MELSRLLFLLAAVSTTLRRGPLVGVAAAANTAIETQTTLGFRTRQHRELTEAERQPDLNLADGFHADIDETVISAGASHTCAIQDSDEHDVGGPVVCWGSDAAGQSSPPDGAVFVQVSAGFLHTCGVLLNGTAACWGQPGMCNPPKNTEFVQVSAGGYHTCGVRKGDSAVVCWGKDYAGQRTGVPAGAFVQVSAGNDHSCALRTNGTLSCWGDNSMHQCNVPPGAAHQFKQVSASLWRHTCAVSLDGEVVCWGFNGHNQAQGPPAPAAVEEGGDAPEAVQYSQVSAGRYSTCAIRHDGAVECWGVQHGASPAGADAPSDFAHVSHGHHHACAVRAGGGAQCWGDGQGGVGMPADFALAL